VYDTNRDIPAHDLNHQFAQSREEVQAYDVGTRREDVCCGRLRRLDLQGDGVWQKLHTDLSLIRQGNLLHHLLDDESSFGTSPQEDHGQSCQQHLHLKADHDFDRVSPEHRGFTGPGCSPIGEQDFSYSQGQLEDAFDLGRIHELSSPGDTLPGSVLCMPSSCSSA
jgi:hypothetical protein